jgi:hypothetical protein
MDKFITSKTFGIFWYRAQIVTALPVAAVMCLGPFFSPFAALSLAQQVSRSDLV